MWIIPGRSYATTMIIWAPMDKIKRFLTMLLAAMLLVLFAGCKGAPAEEVKDTKVTYTITLLTQEGAPIKNVKVFVYEDPTKAELVSVDITDEDGSIAFVDAPKDAFVAVLQDVPVGFDKEEFYTISMGDNKITLLQRSLTPEELSEVRYDLGDHLANLTVTDCDGNNHSISELLKEKKAVVLNFWYLNCLPCKMEFPYLQEAYDAYGDQVAFLALNPVDGTDEKVSSFRYELGLSFPMASCDPAYQTAFQVTSYPTTLIIDKTGVICLVHEGMFTDSTALCNALKYFTQDTYEQQLFEIIEEIPVV